MHLYGQFPGRDEDEAAGRAPAGAGAPVERRSIIGRPNAAVLPVPVCARASRSTPVRTRRNRFESESVWGLIAQPRQRGAGCGAEAEFRKHGTVLECPRAVSQQRCRVSETRRRLWRQQRRPKHECSGRIRLGATQDIRRTGPEWARNLQTAKRVGKSDFVRFYRKAADGLLDAGRALRALPGAGRIIEASRFLSPAARSGPQPSPKHILGGSVSSLDRSDSSCARWTTRTEPLHGDDAR